MENEVQVKHLCAVCNQEFNNEEEYVAHTCAVTGTTPADAEHLIKSTTPNFEQVQQAALDRGAEVKPDEQPAE